MPHKITSDARPDKQGPHRVQFDKQKAKLIKYAKSNGAVCAICNQPIDMELKYPNPYSATVDHIIPLAKGGHPSDADNLQIAHMRCNRLKSDKLITNNTTGVSVGNRTLPQSCQWIDF